MFSKLKQYKDLRSQARALQNTLAQESVTLEKNGISITINGNLEVTALTISADLSKDRLEKSLKDLLNDGIKKVQKIMAQKMQSMDGFSNFS